MRFQFSISIAAIGLIAGCATIEPNDGFENSHRACYAYIYGEDGVDIDYEKALHWCRAGAIDGSRSSMTLLAELIYFGQGTPKDIYTALRLYELAAAGGHNHAQAMVFQIYTLDLADTATCEQKLHGLEYLSEAADSGHEGAIELLATTNEAIGEMDLAETCLP